MADPIPAEAVQAAPREVIANVLHDVEGEGAQHAEALTLAEDVLHALRVGGFQLCRTVTPEEEQADSDAWPESAPPSMAGDRSPVGVPQTAPQSTQAGATGAPRVVGSSAHPDSPETLSALREYEDVVYDRIEAAIIENYHGSPVNPSAVATIATLAVLAVRDAELEALRQRVHRYENAITWNVDCFRCANQLDRLYDADMRRDQTEATLARVVADCEEQTSQPVTDDMRRGIWGQAKRTLNLIRRAGAVSEEWTLPVTTEETEL